MNTQEEFFTLERMQDLFDTNIEELATADHNEIKYLEQNHFGDMLIETNYYDGERLKLWANYDGEQITGVEIEYCGKLNGYRWETVYNS